ncbi:unnamed protein product [Orchesella dallaii]|uniref:Uncharacterized protein n=1 Tax=Orchesella dallaii TaxID=48710 RepID=A0ABP1Q3X2_9HEXA
MMGEEMDLNNQNLNIADESSDEFDSADEKSENDDNEVQVELPQDQQLLLKAMNSTMKKLFKTELKKEIRGVHKKVDDLTKSVKNNSIVQNGRLEKIESENLELKSKLTNLQRENEALQSELREKNLILCGVEDLENESESQLLNKVCEVFKKITLPVDGNIKIRPDKAFRINKFSADKIRNIKVKFSTISERDVIFRNRDNAPDPISIKPDTPYTIRRDHAILKKKENELRQLGQECSVNMKTRQMFTNGVTFNMVDGVLKPANEPMKPVPGPSAASNTGSTRTPAVKRSRTEQNRNFLASETVQNGTRKEGMHHQKLKTSLINQKRQ